MEITIWTLIAFNASLGMLALDLGVSRWDDGLSQGDVLVSSLAAVGGVGQTRMTPR